MPPPVIAVAIPPIIISVPAAMKSVLPLCVRPSAVNVLPFADAGSGNHDDEPGDGNDTTGDGDACPNRLLLTHAGRTLRTTLPLSEGPSVNGRDALISTPTILCSRPPGCAHRRATRTRAPKARRAPRDARG